MKFLENIENGNIHIKRMGIIKAFLVILLSMFLEGLGEVPAEISNLLSGRFEKAMPYVIFAFGVAVKYYIIIILLKWRSSKSYGQNNKSPLNLRNYGYAALMIIAFRLIFDNSLTLWVSTISMPNFINEAFQELSVSPIILLLSVIVVAPIYEEIIFRGILLRGMANKFNPTVALVISALFFALVHMNIPQGINAFLLGLAVGFIYLKTESIYLSIFAHFMNNILALSVSNLFSKIYAIQIRGIFLIIGVILLIIAYRGHNLNKIKNRSDIYSQFNEI